MSNFAVAVVVGAGLLSACGDARPSATPTGPLVSRSRCAANRAAGPIDYLTGYGWEASVGILDPIVAKSRGYYKAMCLTVKLTPGTGNPAASGQLVAGGKATVTELGSPSDGITDVAGSPSIPVDAIATYGNTTIDTLVTMRAVTNLRQLDGKTIGYENAMPPDITAMLEKAGVNMASLKEVALHSDPNVLPRGQVQAITAYRSNEPIELRDEGYRVREWDPGSFGIKGAFNVLDVNRAWADAHPRAVEDFLRATFEAFRYCRAHAKSCVEEAAKYQAGYQVRQNTQRWEVESGIVEDTLLPGHGVGYEGVAQWEPDYHLLLKYHLIKAHVDLADIVDGHYVKAIYSGRRLIWPGP
ncbi:MAG: ABC transporter substrate-binding protein [Acidimicrobiales bacterium]